MFGIGICSLKRVLGVLNILSEMYAARGRQVFYRMTSYNVMKLLSQLCSVPRKFNLPCNYLNI